MGGLVVLGRGDGWIVLGGIVGTFVLALVARCSRRGARCGRGAVRRADAATSWAAGIGDAAGRP